DEFVSKQLAYGINLRQIDHTLHAACIIDRTVGTGHVVILLVDDSGRVQRVIDLAQIDAVGELLRDELVEVASDLRGDG
ncbi:MAG: hypothetical protein AAF747_08295, partial [Planctomycetota bacterium]